MFEKLLILARPEFVAPLRAALASWCDALVVARPEDGDWKQSFLQMPLAVRAKVGGIVVVAPLDCDPAEVAPGPCLTGVPVGIIMADRPAELRPWLAALRATCQPPTTKAYYVLAMWKQFYLAWAERFTAALQAGYGRGDSIVMSLFADNTPRDVLCEVLWQGPQLAQYLGHGRSRGWSGYRGFRWHHVASGAQIRPIGSLVALTCDNLKPGREGEISFGMRWVLEGRAGAFFGATGGLDIPPLETIGSFFLARFAAGDCCTLGQVIAAVGQDVDACGETAVQQNWARFRLVGNPLQTL